jgi:hypothetical protein
MFEFLKHTKKEPENVAEILKELRVLSQELSGVSREIEALKKESQLHLKKVGFIRYNPFSNIGSDQSFSLALLDGENNGILITSLFSREGNRVYAKAIKNGQSEYPLSDEEEQALEEAKGF